MSWFTDWHRLARGYEWEGWTRSTPDGWTLSVFRPAFQGGEAQDPSAWRWSVHRTQPPSGPSEGGSVAGGDGPVDARCEAEAALERLRLKLHQHAAEGQEL